MIQLLMRSLQGVQVSQPVGIGLCPLPDWNLPPYRVFYQAPRVGRSSGSAFGVHTLDINSTTTAKTDKTLGDTLGD